MITAQQTTAIRGYGSVFLCDVCHKRHPSIEACVCSDKSQSSGTLLESTENTCPLIFMMLRLWCFLWLRLFIQREFPSFTSFCLLSMRITVSYCIASIYGHINMGM